MKISDLETARFMLSRGHTMATAAGAVWVTKLVLKHCLELHEDMKAQAKSGFYLGPVRPSGPSGRTRIVDLRPGERFGRLTVQERAGSTRGWSTWRCTCDCGAEVVARGASLRSSKGRRQCGPACPCDPRRERSRQKRLAVQTEAERAKERARKTALQREHRAEQRRRSSAVRTSVSKTEAGGSDPPAGATRARSLRGETFRQINSAATTARKLAKKRKGMPVDRAAEEAAIEAHLAKEGVTKVPSGMARGALRWWQNGLYSNAVVEDW